MNLVIETGVVRKDKEGRYSLNDLHKAALAAGHDVERKNPANFLRNDFAKDFIKVVEKKEVSQNTNLSSAVSVVNGGRKPGTYAHYSVTLKYCGWLCPEFEVYIYDFFANFHLAEEARQNARANFPEMTAAIKEYRESKGEEVEFYHYTTECDLVNVTVLGCTAKQFRKFHKIPDADAIRDYMSPLQIKALNYIQSINTFLIEEGFTLAERRDKLKSRFDTKYASKIKAEMDKLLESI